MFFPVFAASAAAPANSAEGSLRGKAPATKTVFHHQPRAAEKPDDFPAYMVASTRQALLRSTTALTKVSTALHSYYASMGQAFTMMRMMEAGAAFAQLFMPFARLAPPAPAQPQIWLAMFNIPAASQPAFAPFPAASNLSNIAPAAALMFAATAAFMQMAPQFDALFQL